MFVTRARLRHSGVGCDGQPIRLSLCMIVRDNAATLRPCLASIRPWVDEMVVVDTGSTDETPSIAQEFGARLFHFPWCDDFSAARNESLRHARGQWLFWMDSDDTIDPDNGRKLRDLVNGPDPLGVVAYVMQVHCPVHRDETTRGLTVVDHIKWVSCQMSRACTGILMQYAGLGKEARDIIKGILRMENYPGLADSLDDLLANQQCAHWESYIPIVNFLGYIRESCDCCCRREVGYKTTRL